MARQLAQAQGAIVIIVDGFNGHGFSAQLTEPMIAEMPDVLRQIAGQIEAHGPGAAKE